MLKGLSVVIPAFNAADWLEPTVAHIMSALAKAGLGENEAEIVIVNDGSSDATEAAALNLAKKSKIPIRVLSHTNQGRFLTRKRGVENAKYDTILFVDTRVWIDEDSLLFIKTEQTENPDRLVWNGHVNVQKKGNIIARFGDAITFIGWRRYFGNPRLTSYGRKDFDHYPKGTGFFLAPRVLLLESIIWFEKQTKDLRNSSDDTLLIRHIAESNQIWLSPDFRCTYFARTNLKAFLRHSFYRGQYFVDGFLRRGTRFYYPLIAFLVLSVALLAICISRPQLVAPLLFFAAVVWLLELVTALGLKVQARDAGSLFVLTPLFTVAYGMGIWRAVIRRLLNG